MSITTPSSLPLARAGTLTLRQRWARHLLFQKLRGLRQATLRWQDPDGTYDFGDGAGLQATLRVLDPSFYTRVLAGGSLGAAEAYMDGSWESSGMTDLVRILCRNEATGRGVEGGLARLRAPFDRLAHALRRNDPRGSRDNIAAHYDLGNEFFETFLDETMMYSSAVFPHREADLATASRHKLDLVCDKLALRPRHHVLEIGTGWGGFALHAARRHGCRVTTTTISRKQYEHTLDAVRRADLADRVTVLDRDYRELPRSFRGSFDRLVSIEMIEAVGERFLDTYLRACSDVLQPNGVALLQAILIADRNYERYRRSVDFIQRYIFPGGFLPSMENLRQRLGTVTDLHVEDVDDISSHYARTLRAWRRRFHANENRIAALGFDERFRRMWDFYFCYCEGGLEERNVSVAQIVLAKPGRRPSCNG